MKVIISIVILLAILLYMLIFTASKNKANEDRIKEDEEQMKYLRKYGKEIN